MPDASRPADPPIVHGDFTLLLPMPAPPAEVFAAFAQPALRRRWFRLPGASASASHALDFRVGGEEVASNTFGGNGLEERVAYRARFLDIVSDQRIVYSYEAVVDGLRRWVSLVTIGFSPVTDGCRLSWTEQFAFLLPSTADGGDDVAHLRGGTRLRLNGLLAVVASEAGSPTDPS